MKHGPHSISELISWHRHGYLEDSTVVRCNNSFSEIVYKLQIWCGRGNDELISSLSHLNFFCKFIYEARITFSFNARVLEVSTVLVEFPWIRSNRNSCSCPFL